MELSFRNGTHSSGGLKRHSTSKKKQGFLEGHHPRCKQYCHLSHLSSAFIRWCGPQWFCKCVDMQRCLYADPKGPAGLENPQEPRQTGLCIPAPQEICTDPACTYLQKFSDCRSLPFCKLVDFQLHRSSKISLLANLQVNGAPQICARACPQSEKLCRSLLIWSCTIL